MFPWNEKKSSDKKNIINVFVENGMIDFENNRFPDFNKILATFRKDLTVEEYNLCETHFPNLLQKYLYDGHVDYAVFEEVDFPVDVYECGNEVRWTETISKGSIHRAKILTHANQDGLCAEWSVTLKAGFHRNKDDRMSVLE